MMDEDQIQVRSKRPSNNPLKQQRLKAFQPIHTFKSSIITFSCLMAMFVIFGLVTLISSMQVVEVTKRYDDIDACKGNWSHPKTCEVTVTVDDTMDSPVYLYYELRNFFQNHRVYVKSRDDKQLAGTDAGQNQFCTPVTDMSDVGARCGNETSGFYYCSMSGEPLEGSDSANPCGLIAKSLFNGPFYTDTYELIGSDGKELAIKESGIAWSSDLDYLYSHAGNHTSDQWTDVEDGIIHTEHFAVWMRTAAFPIFRKLWGVIEHTMKGNYTFVVTSRYDVSKWDGEKHIILSTANAFGGRNPFLGIVYLSAAGVAGCMIVVFILRGKFGARVDIDLKNLKWD